ncbi:hypothetical protein B0T16DRAFT_142225 [Cercophora newfieldiana]|uniref:Uncharacterized protein n=1 Tax=Cercophora newfieldiana TaxID=92897 RepID=A0AA39Y3W7_9PEZI|nr:hypothetical protein B0T16DRAFT_142225 [Cercophora newfieldiana]
MVGRRRVLLSVAVLGVEAVLGGPLGRREDVALSNTAALPPRPLPTPITRPTVSVVVEITASVNIGTDDAGTQQTTSIPAAAPPVVPTKPAGAPPAIPVPKPPVTVEEGSIELGEGSTPVGNSPIVVEEEEVVDFAAATTPPTVPTKPAGGPPVVPKPVVVVEEEIVEFGSPTTTTTPPTVPTKAGGPPIVPKPPVVVEEEVVDFGTPTTTTPPTVPTKPAGGPPVVPKPPVVVEEEVIDFGAPTTTSTTTPPAVPTKPGGPPVVPKPPVVVEEEVIDFGTPTTTTTTTPPSVPTKAGPPVVPKPPVVVEEEGIDFGTPTTTTPPTVPTKAGGPPVVAPPVKVVTLESDFDFGGGASPNTGDGNEAQTEYTYPGVWVSGSLVTATNSISRTALPSAKSLPPSTTSRKPPRPPGVNMPDTDTGVDEDGDPASDAAASTGTGPLVIPTPPRGPPPKIITTSVTALTTSEMDFTFPEPSPTPNSYANVSSQPPPTTVLPGTVCQASDIELMYTTYSIVYTSTLTWVGNPEDYTPLYPPISTPAPPDCIIAPDPARFTFATTTVCSSTGTGTKFVTCYATTASYVYTNNQPATTEAVMAPGYLSPPQPSNMVTVITTDKNPAVVFPTKAAPNYGVTSAPRTQDPHSPVTTPSNNNNNPPAYDQDGTPSQGPMREPPATPPVTVAVKPTAVVINDHTITDDPSGKTSVVIISGVTFTIGPSQVIGGGTTIDRNTITGGGLASTPTSTRIGNINVVVSSSIAVVGDTSFTLGPTSSTAIVSGQTVVIGPSAVVVAGETLSAPTIPRPTEVVVAGGDLITAIGQSVVVIQSTTITYGLTGTSTTVIDNDTITFGPGGVTVHGTTLGGTAAKPGATDFAVAGGATITKIGASVVVIAGSTYTVGPGMGTTTTVVGGETITIGPDGVKVATLTLPWPFGPTVVITPKATPTGGAEATAAGAEEDAAVGLKPGMVGVVLGLVLGVVVLL